MKRRHFVTGAAVAGTAALVARTAQAAGPQWNRTYSGGSLGVKHKSPGLPGKDYTPVITPDGGAIPFKIIDGVKVFHITVSEFEHEFMKGLKCLCWGYNGRINASTLEAVEGDRVRIYVTNKIQAPTTIHWHGVYLPNGMDGVSSITQAPIPPGKTGWYEFTLRQWGTFAYHSHHDTMTQEAMGLHAMFIVHPRRPSADYRVDRDFVLSLSEWSIDVGTRRPNPNAMSDFNMLTFNGRAYPGTTPLVIKTGERVRIRFGNFSAMDHHPIHLHGYHFKITGTDGEHIPTSAQWPETTVLVSVGQTRDIEFIADAPGDWLMHCHMTHHVMNQMGHNAPNMIGVKPGDLDAQVTPLVPGYMTMGQTGMGGMEGMPVPKNSVPMVGRRGPFGYSGMGGMFTIVKVRDELSSYDDPGWYKHPKGTVSRLATDEELKRDGIKV
ncbi:copper oxidase [Desulfobulbus sp. AH-315-M07]|nr:copper oxidase [Desulfobulbus sp. AH-315-M07]